MPEPSSKNDPPLIIVLNAGSGKADPAETRAIIEHELSQAKREYELYVVESGISLGETVRRAIERASNCSGVIVAVGGDGTISTVARAALDSGCVFGIVPQGTFNYFGRAYGIPEDTAEAVRLLAYGRPRLVQVGLVNGMAFLVNASLGLHPQMLEDREAFARQYGRSRLAALWSGLRTLLHHRLQLRLRIEIHGMTREVRTPTLFVSNNWLQLGQIGIPLTEELAQGQLAALILRPVSTWGMLWLLLRGALGRLGEAKNVISFSFDRMRVWRPGFYGERLIKVAVDGEIHELDAPLEFRVSPQSLQLLMQAAG